MQTGSAAGRLLCARVGLAGNLPRRPLQMKTPWLPVGRPGCGKGISRASAAEPQIIQTLTLLAVSAYSWIWSKFMYL